MKPKKSVIFWALLFIGPLSHAEPEHLIPIPPCEFNTSAEVVYTSLIGGKYSSRLWMIAIPYRSTEHAIVLRHHEEYDDNDVFQYEHWELELVESKYQIFIPEHVRPPIELTHQNVVISEDFAKIIESAWVNALKQTRYPDPYYLSEFGTDYLFNCDIYYGMTKSPQSGSPKALVELGSLLESFVKANEGDRDKIKQQCILLVQMLSDPNQGMDLTRDNAQSIVP